MRLGIVKLYILAGRLSWRSRWGAECFRIITLFCLLNRSTYMLDLNSYAVTLDNLSGTSHAVAMGCRLICAHCFLIEQQNKHKNDIQNKM